MANGVTRSIVGSMSGLGVLLLDASEQRRLAHNHELTIAVVTFFGKLPDILEPALRNLHHLHFFHNVTVLLAYPVHFRFLASCRGVYKWLLK